MIKDVNEAWSVLSDKDKRNKYDSGAWDHGGGGGMGGMGGHDSRLLIFLINFLSE